MYCKEKKVRLSLGMSTPRIRGIRTISEVRFCLLLNRPSDATQGGHRLTLPLLVTRIRANHVYFASTAHDFAVLTDSLYARSNFHFLFNSHRMIGARETPTGTAISKTNDTALLRAEFRNYTHRQRIPQVRRLKDFIAR